MSSPSPAGGSRRDEIVVFIRRGRDDSRCAGCGKPLWKGAFLRIKEGQPRCLSCAGLNGLEFLPSGDPLVTRRASKYSRLRAVVVRWSRARKRYERQGILAEPGAIARAQRDKTVIGDKASSESGNKWTARSRKSPKS